MGTSIFALILSHIGTTYVISLIACEVSAVQDVVPSNSWNLCFGEAAETLTFDYIRVTVKTDGGKTTEHDDNYLNHTCGCTLDRNDFSLGVECAPGNVNSSLDMSKLLCPHELHLSYQRSPKNSSADPLQAYNKGKKNSTRTVVCGFIPVEHIDATMLTLLLILLVALLTSTALACLYCRAASALAGVPKENRVINYAAENVGSFAGAISETTNEIRVLEISEPITDKLVRFEEKYEGSITHEKSSTASFDEHIYHSVSGRKITSV